MASMGSLSLHERGLRNNAERVPKERMTGNRPFMSAKELGAHVGRSVMRLERKSE